MTQMMLVVGFAVVVLTVALYWNSRTERIRRNLFAGRKDVSVDEIYARFYSDSVVSKPQLEQALREVANCLGVPATRLLPSDRFLIELAPEPGWEFDDGLGILTSLAEKKLLEQGSRDPTAVAQIQTVDDYVRLSAAVKHR